MMKVRNFMTRLDTVIMVPLIGLKRQLQSLKRELSLFQLALVLIRPLLRVAMQTCVESVNRGSPFSP